MCACRSASSTSTTSSPISIRLSQPRWYPRQKLPEKRRRGRQLRVAARRRGTERVLTAGVGRCRNRYRERVVTVDPARVGPLRAPLVFARGELQARGAFEPRALEAPEGLA